MVVDVRENFEKRQAAERAAAVAAEAKRDAAKASSRTPTPVPVKTVTPAAKPAAKAPAKTTAIPAPKTNAEMSKTADDILRQLGEAGVRVDEQEKRVAALLKEEQDRLARVAEGQIELDKKAKEDEISKDTRNAFAILKDTFSFYGLDSLADEISKYMKEGLGTAEATIRLKQSKAYTDRFKGNELRRAAGLNAIDEAAYLDLEDSYSETLKAYGLQDYFGVGVTATQRLTRQQAMAEVIGKDISAVEFKDRVSTSVDRVKMADPATKKAFQDFYGIGEADLVKYFLDPAKSLVTLKERATAAEIGGAAIGQGLPTAMATAEDLARFGISREQAQAGYGVIAEVLPTAEKLSAIYDEDKITYGQTEAEAETFKGLASAKRKRQQLTAKEIGTFSGSSGVGAAGLSTTYLRRGSSAGQF
jgi:hypothetical protein